MQRMVEANPYTSHPLAPALRLFAIRPSDTTAAKHRRMPLYVLRRKVKIGFRFDVVVVAVDEEMAVEVVNPCRFNVVVFYYCTFTCTQTHTPLAIVFVYAIASHSLRSQLKLLQKIYTHVIYVSHSLSVFLYKKRVFVITSACHDDEADYYDRRGACILV